MKNIFHLCILFISLSSCNVIKLKKEFNNAKANNEIVLVYNEISSVEKNKAINVLISKYLDSAPEDKVLTEFINQHIKYNLDAYGYKNIISKEVFQNKDWSKELTYELVFDGLLLREFKKTESVTDDASGVSDKVKLKGIETQVYGNVYLLKNKKRVEGATKKVKASNREIETHSGEFKHTKNLKEHVFKESGSMKYLAQVNGLEGGIFQSQCILIAEKIAAEINGSLIHLYVQYNK